MGQSIQEKNTPESKIDQLINKQTIKTHDFEKKQFVRIGYRCILFVGLIILQIGIYKTLSKELSNIYKLSLSQLICFFIPTLIVLFYDKALYSLFSLSNFFRNLLLGFIVGLFCFFANSSLIMLLKKIYTFKEPYNQTLLQTKIPTILKWVCLALEPAISEELLFKILFIGPFFLNTQSVSAPKRYLAFLLASCIFALMHGSGLQFLPLLMYSIITCILTFKTQSIYPAIFFHLLNNSIAIALTQLKI